MKFLFFSLIFFAITISPVLQSGRNRVELPKDSQINDQTWEIITDYDKFRDSTIVMIKPMQVDCSPMEKIDGAERIAKDPIMFSASFSFKGKNKIAPAKIDQIDFDSRLINESHDLWVLIDEDKRFRFADPKITHEHGLILSSKGSIMIIPKESFVSELVRAKTVEFKHLFSQWILTTNNLAALRDLDKRAKTE